MKAEEGSKPETKDTMVDHIGPVAQLRNPGEER